VNAAVVIGCVLSARNASERSEDSLVALTDDVVRASEAELAAERMVAVGRGYLLTAEPELLARAQAAEGKLERTLQGFQRSLTASGDGDLLASSLSSAARYRERFEVLMSGPLAGQKPQAVADALRGGLLPARDQLESDLQDLVERRQRQQAEIRGTAGDWAARVIRIMVVLGALGTVGSALLAWAVIRSLKRLRGAFSGPFARQEAPSRSPYPAVRSVDAAPTGIRAPSAPRAEVPRPEVETLRRRTPEPRWWPRGY
jgi:CHASE3 domain sensor protein